MARGSFDMPSRWRVSGAVLRAFAFVVACLVGALVAFAPRAAWAFTPPQLEGPVSDHAHVLTASEKASLEQKIQEFRTRTGHEVAVLTVPTLGGETVEDFAYKTAKAWALGSEKNDDGVLLLLATGERKIRIETGKGVGGDLTDVDASHIIRDQIAPRLKGGKFGAGLTAGVDAIIAKLSGMPMAPPPKAKHASPATGKVVVAVVVIVVLLLVVVAQAIRNRGGGGGGGYGGGGFFFFDGGGGGGSDYGGGGDSGGGGGDFGGGGGDFGGGGSSGDY